MIPEIKQLVRELKKENEKRAEDLQDTALAQESRTYKTYCYNNTLDVIKRIEAIVGQVPR